MNKKQKIVLWIGIIIFVLVSLNPPQKSHRTPLRPSRRRASRDNAPIVNVVVIGAGDVDGAKLLSHWLIIIVLTGGLIYTFKDRKDKKPKAEQKNN